jgi:hypothetical protein
MRQHSNDGSSVVTRRALLKRGLLAGLGMAGASLLAACQQAPPASPAKPAMIGLGVWGFACFADGGWRYGSPPP